MGKVEEDNKATFTRGENTAITTNMARDATLF